MKSSPFGSFIRNVQREPKRFNYKPRYYDREKEEFQRRLERIDREIARERGEEVSGAPTGVSFSASRRHVALSRSRRQSNRRVLSIVVLLCLLAGLLWFMNYGVNMMNNEGVDFFERILK